jgi:hypothetical protein
MRLRFHIDPETGQPHIYEHGVREEEVRQVLVGRGDDFRGSGKSRICFGQTAAGRYLKVIYVPDPERDSVFVITAFDLRGKAIKAFRRRHRRKSK